MLSINENFTAALCQRLKVVLQFQISTKERAKVLPTPRQRRSLRDQSHRHLSETQTSPSRQANSGRRPVEGQPCFDYRRRKGVEGAFGVDRRPIVDLRVMRAAE